uniref:Neuropeptide-Like Protein n=1 Tax=Steinernema glaseri TaxID=37863 RepID=A0A1I7YL47_9BILA
MKFLLVLIVVLFFVNISFGAEGSYETPEGSSKDLQDKRSGHPTWRQYARVRHIAHGGMPVRGGPSAFWEGSRPGFVRFIRTRPYTGEMDLPYY